MLALLALVLVGGAGASSLVERPSATASVDTPVLLGIVTSCSGNAPSAPSCSTGPFWVDCARGCRPWVSGTLGYTGWAAAFIDGDGGTAWQVCEFVAGQIATVGPASAGTKCTDGGPSVLGGPYTLRGQVWPSAGRAPLWRGPFTANAVQMQT